MGKLYLPCTMYWNGERWRWFWCRHCLDLTYAQRQQRDLSWTLEGRAERLKQRWLDEDEDGEHFVKPKGTHWTTFEKRCEQYNELIERANGHFLHSLARFLR
ncbi:MAG: hypothetical protein M1370_07425 [Bacteroidetes bacterium]|nr:hypothetical protein [Bacteroidota bacterium]